MKSGIAPHLRPIAVASIAIVGVWDLTRPAAGLAQSANADLGKFDVASIRPGCNGRGSRPGPPTPGRLNVCQTLEFYIRSTHEWNLNGRATGGWHTIGSDDSRNAPILGGPHWINSDIYEIDAKAEGTPSVAIMMGPMLQALLEDRFKLRIHREPREIPVYALKVAKGGFKLKPLKEGSCTTITAPPLGVPVPFRCGTFTDPRPGTLYFHGVSMDIFAMDLFIDRPVIDKTGIAGIFDFRLDYTPDEATPTPPGALLDDPTGPSIFTAVEQQLGLKLEPAKGPGESLVIDHVERPSEN